MIEPATARAARDALLECLVELAEDIHEQSVRGQAHPTAALAPLQRSAAAFGKIIEAAAILSELDDGPG